MCKRDIIFCITIILAFIFIVCSVIITSNIIFYSALGTSLLVCIIYVCDLTFIKFSNWLDK